MAVVRHCCSPSHRKPKCSQSNQHTLLYKGSKKTVVVVVVSAAVVVVVVAAAVVEIACRLLYGFRKIGK